MRFYLLDSQDQDVPATARRPYATLAHDRWDDFGYKTTFRVEVHLADGSYTIGSAKILHKGQRSGPTELPGPDFTRLGRRYCSLGQDLNYYRRLSKLPWDVVKSFLRGISDVVFDASLRKTFEEEEEGFRVSLTRFSSATTALVNGAQAMDLPLEQPARVTRKRSPSLRFGFQTPLASSAEPVTATFDFTRRGILPNRVNVTIGYNGTGKTQLLSNLATVVSGYGYSTKEDLLDRVAGRFTGDRPPFDRAVVVSYSAFDTFEIPGRTPEELEQLKEGRGKALFSYVYCGLRERLSTAAGSEDAYRLKSHSELVNEFRDAVEGIVERTRLDLFTSRILQPLYKDASLKRVGFNSRVVADADAAVNFFKPLSTGHKIVLMIAAQLAWQVEPGTLVIVDEPEAHLHPPLLASLLHCIRACLHEFDAYAVIATHSPVVLQETPSRYVQVLRRRDEASETRHPEIETFAENIGLITQDVFNLDDSSTDWHKTLQDLVEAGKTLEQIEELFGTRLGFVARSYVLSIQDNPEDFPGDEEVA